MKKISENAKVDLELVNAIKSKKRIKSEKAFNTLFKKYHNSMLFYFKGLVKDEFVAEELVLDSFIKISKNIDKFNKETASFSTWLFTMTRNLFIDRLRKKKENLISLSDLSTIDDDNHVMEYEIESEDDNPEKNMLNSERARKILTIINSLTNSKLRTVIKMRFYQNLSYEEIAKKINIPKGTVSALLFRAKQVLKIEFKKADISW